MRQQTVLERITERLKETKTPCKLYKTEQAAEKVGHKTAKMVAEYFSANQPALFNIIHIPSINKYAVAFNLNELLSRPETGNGYIGICGDHFTF